MTTEHLQPVSEQSTGAPHKATAVRGLGWFSIGLGLTQVMMPGTVSKFIGLKNHKGLMRILGFREIASGLGIFSQRSPSMPLWARVGGDVIDLALLSGALTSPKTNRSRIAVATAAVAGVTALDLYYSRQLSNGKTAIQPPLTKTITINRSAEDLYRMWRNFQNLPRFMKHLESVEVLSENRSRWTAKLPGGKTLQWESEILLDRPNEEIVWQTLEGSDIQHSGSVRFEPASARRGCHVILQMENNEERGRVRSTIAKLLGKIPEQFIHEDLRRFKQLMETGEVATTEGQPSGKRGIIKQVLEARRKE
jgi:uncharacterized membrane protein